MRGRRWNSGDLLRRTPGPFFYGCHEGHVRPHKLYKNHGQVQAQVRRKQFPLAKREKENAPAFFEEGTKCPMFKVQCCFL